jgi:hypothetical protein
MVECPACKSRELYEIQRVCFEATDSINGIITFALFAHYGPSGKQGWFGDKQERTAITASARICGACGHASLFTQDLDRLRAFAAQGLVRKLTP